MGVLVITVTALLFGVYSRALQGIAEGCIQATHIYVCIYIHIYVRLLR